MSIESLIARLRRYDDQLGGVTADAADVIEMLLGIMRLITTEELLADCRHRINQKKAKEAPCTNADCGGE